MTPLDDLSTGFDSDTGILAGRYRIEKTLSRRVSTSTLLCIDEETDTPCVVKTFSQVTLEERERLRTRVSRLQRMTHEGVARCLGFVEEPTLDEVAIVWEWVEGQTLAEMIADGKRFADDELYACLRGVLTALADADVSVDPQHTLVHRDIKPQKDPNFNLRCPLQLHYQAVFFTPITFSAPFQLGFLIRRQQRLLWLS